MEMAGQQVAVVTGASRGIGSGLVEAYRKQGYSVVANSRTITDSPNSHVRAVAGDIADPTTAERIVATLPDYQLFTAANLTGFFHLTQRVIAQMLAQGDGGHVVTMSTTLVEHAE